MSTTNTIPAIHKKNPTYYEARAGYPEPTAEWYSEKRDGKLVKPVYTNEKFVTGFNIECGEFYMTREDVVKMLHRRDLIGVPWNTVEAKVKLHEIYDKLRKFYGDKETVPPYWRDKMIIQFVRRTSEWATEQKIMFTQKGKISGNPSEKASWSWGPERKAPKFDGFFQYQHLNLLIGFPRPEGADDSEPGFTVGVKCCDITTRGVYNFTPVDISLDEIDFFSLIDDLNQAEHIDFSLETHSLKYKLPSSPKSLLAINSSLTLQRAISALRAPMCSEIRLWAVANEEVVPDKLAVPKKRKRTDGGDQGKKTRSKGKLPLTQLKLT